MTEPASFAFKELDMMTILPVALFVTTAVVGNDEPRFPTPILANSPIGQIALQDFDRDGRLDLWAIQTFPKSLEVRLGLGGGSFGPPLVIPLPVDPWDFAIGDIDRNGYPDILIASKVSTGILVARADGLGGFLPFETAAHPSECTELVLVDLDADEDLDIVANSNSDPLRAITLFNDGSGHFPMPLVSPQSFAVVHIAVADITGDGIQDLAYSSVGLSGNGILVAPGIGDGTFTNPPKQTAAGYTLPVPLTAADFDEDGRADLVFGNSVLRGMPDGSLIPLATISAGGIATARDFDFDGHMDIFFGGGPILVRGLGNGTFAPFLGSSVGSTETYAVGDLDGDALPDAVLSLPYFAACVVLGRDGWLGTSLQGGFVFDGQGLTTSPAADFDLDGDLDRVDRVYKANGAAGIVAYLQQNDGSFLIGEKAFGALLGTDVPFAEDLQIGDLDLNGRTDVVVRLIAGTFSNDGVFETYRGLAAGKFANEQSKSYTSEPIRSMQLFDQDDDGLLDLRLDRGLGVVQKVEVRRGNGNVRFAAGFETDAVTALATNGSQLADLNNDGLGDLLLASSSPVAFGVRLATAPFTFAPRTTLPVPFGFSGLLLGDSADFDADGNLDIALTDTNVALAVARGNGTGGIASIVPHAGALPPFASAVLATDLDADGAADLVVSSSFHQTLQILEGDGTAGFTDDGSYFTAVSGIGVRAVDIADMNADGLPDILLPGRKLLPGIPPLETCIGTIHSVGLGCFGAGAISPLLTATGCPAAGSTLTVALSSAPPDALGFLFVGLPSPPIPIALGCRLDLFPISASIPIATSGTTSGTGALTFTTVLPSALPTTTIRVQALVLDPSVTATIALSNAVELGFP